MYDVASRTIIVRSTTGEDVGPSTYLICNPKVKKQNAAPFCSITKRVSPTNKINTEAIYDTRGFNNQVKGIGVSSLRNKTARFIYKEDCTPGPQTYSPLPRWMKKRVFFDPSKPKIYLCSTPHAVTIVAPSIPTKLDQNGYDLDEDGNIVKVPVETPRKSVLNVDVPMGGLNDGCKWSKRTSKRFPSREEHAPGPMDYQVELPKCRTYEADERYREMARLFSFVPRFLEQQQMRIEREGLPGPGTYNVVKPAFAMSKPLYPRPFISGAARFLRSSSASPSPNQYKICDCSTKAKHFSVKETPFGVTARRLQYRNIAGLPGPASYDVKGPLHEKMMRKKNQYAIVRPPFNNTAKRDLNNARRDAAYTPSPADYPAEELDETDDDLYEEGREDVTASVFKSVVHRFPFKCPNAPSPARYTISDKSGERKCHSTGLVPFNFSGLRSTTPTVQYGVPAATEYDYQKPLFSGGHTFNTTPRFPEPRNLPPGPTRYTIHPSKLDSNYKAVYTASLKLRENVLKEKLKLAPAQTKKQYGLLLKKKKLLRWFDNGEPDYEKVQLALLKKLFGDTEEK